MPHSCISPLVPSIRSGTRLDFGPAYVHVTPLFYVSTARSIRVRFRLACTSSSRLVVSCIILNAMIFGHIGAYFVALCDAC